MKPEPISDEELGRANMARRESRGARRWFGPFPVAGLVLGIGLAVSYALWRNAENDLAREEHALLDSSSSLAVTSIQRRLDEYQSQLFGMQGLFAISERIDRREFRLYFETLNRRVRLPGIKAAHFTRYVLDAELAEFTASVRNDKTQSSAGFPDFAVHPDGRRPEYFVIDYIEPLAKNRAAFGFDVASQRVNLEALLAARELDKPTITPPLQLVQSAKGERGLVMRAPVYRYGLARNSGAERRRAFVGLVGISIDAGDMFRDVFSEPYLGGLRIAVYDVAPSASGEPPQPLRQLVANNWNRPVAVPDAAALSSTTVVPAGERLWEIEVSAAPDWIGRRTGNEATLAIPATGAAISILLALLYLVLARLRTRAEQLAASMTSDLRRSEQESRRATRVLQATLDNISQGISVVDSELQMTALNRRFCEILDFPPHMGRGTSTFESFARFNAERGEYGPCNVEDKVRELMERARNVQPHRFRRKRPNGTIVEVIGTPLPGGGFVTTYTDVTDQERAEQELRRSEARYRALVELLPEAVLMLRERRIMFANESALLLFGAAAGDQVLGHHFAEFLPPEWRDRTERALLALEAEAPPGQRVPWLERQCMRLDGRIVAVEAAVTRVELEDGLVVLLVLRDITERKLTDARLLLAASVFTHAREGIMITDADGDIVEVNDTFSTITGFSRAEALGRNPRILRSNRHPPEYYAAMWRDITGVGHWSGEIWDCRKDGEEYPKMLTITAVRDSAGNIKHFVALFSDITALKEQQQKLEYMAHNDTLTGLPNRVLLADRLQQAMARATRSKSLVAVVYLDLDGFKAVNDRHGHDVGDELLIAISRRMKSALREGDTLSRLGGDEFVAVLADLEQAQDCEPVLSRLLQAVATPTPVGELTLELSASIGVTIYPLDQADADQLLRHADQAMYQAKQAGKNCYDVFDLDQDAAVSSRRESVEHVRRAIKQHEFMLHYQPKVNMKTGAVIGAEALIRWRHPERGLLYPAAFLPNIENHPVSADLGEWVIDTALSQMAQWRAIGLDLPVSVNVGAYQLQREQFVASLAALLARHPEIQPGGLELEVLETSALTDIVRVSEIMHACRALGVHFALDDFGTGYSSLTYLKRLPVELLKIDQSFIRDMHRNPDDMAIVESVLGLAATFKRRAIAEGVETVAHGELLLALGCELAQGYCIAKPMPAEALPEWVAQWRPDAAWTNRKIPALSG